MNIENGVGGTACADLAAALVLAADDELTTAEWRAVESHLGRCAACRSEWAAIARIDQRLRECGAVINTQNPPDPAVRLRLVNALSNRRRGPVRGGTPRQRKCGWALAPAAGLCVAAIAVWIVLVPEWGRHFTDGSIRQPRGPVSAVMAPGNAEVVRVKLALAPVGDPFPDGSAAESSVLADVVVGSDGQPRDIKLAE